MCIRDRIGIAFALNPQISPAVDGDLLLTLEPEVHVVTALSDFDIDFDLSGTNVFVQAGALITGIPSRLTEGLGAGLTGGSISDALAGLSDVAFPIGLTLVDLGTPLVSDILLSSQESELVEQANNLSIDLEDDLNEQVAEALGLENGRVTYEIDRDFAQLLDGGASLEDLLVLVAG